MPEFSIFSGGGPDCIAGNGKCQRLALCQQSLWHSTHTSSLQQEQNKARRQLFASRNTLKITNEKRKNRLKLPLNLEQQNNSNSLVTHFEKKKILFGSHASVQHISAITFCARACDKTSSYSGQSVHACERQPNYFNYCKCAQVKRLPHAFIRLNKEKRHVSRSGLSYVPVGCAPYKTGDKYMHILFIKKWWNYYTMVRHLRVDR